MDSHSDAISIRKIKEFLYLKVRARLYNMAIIVAKISNMRNDLDFSKLILFERFLMQLSALGGKIGFLLIRRYNIPEFYIIFYNSLLFLKDINNLLNNVIAIFESFASTLGLNYDELSDIELNAILDLLSRIAIYYSRRTRIRVRSINLPKLELLDNFSLIPNKLGDITKTLDSTLEQQGVLVIVDLTQIKTLIANAGTQRNTKQSFLGKRKLHLVFVTISFKNQNYNPSEIPKSLADIYLHSLFKFTNLLGDNIEYKLSEKSNVDLTTLLRLIAHPRYNMIIHIQDISSIKPIALLIYSMIASLSRKIAYPTLDISINNTIGDIHIGWQLKNGVPIAPFFLKLNDIKRHVLILGRTGVGKTRLTRIIIQEILKKSASKVWIFDFHREYIDLTNRYYFHVFEPGTTERPLYLNIFDNPYEEPESYSSFLTSLLIEISRLKGTEITAQMERAISYAVWNTLNSEDKNPQTFFQQLWFWCKEQIEDIPSAIYTFYAITNRLKSIFSGVSEKIFWVEASNIDIPRLLNKNLIFDLSFLFKRNLKREILLLVNIILRYVMMVLFRDHFLLDDELSPRLVVVLEEGRYLVPWRKIESSLDTTAIEDFVTLSRKYGLGLIILSQSPYIISSDILSNAGTVFLFNSDIPEREYLIVDDEKLRHYIQLMPPRHAIVKLSTNPSLVHIRIKPININRKYTIVPKRHEETLTFGIDFESYITQLIDQK